MLVLLLECTCAYGCDGPAETADAEAATSELKCRAGVGGVGVEAFTCNDRTEGVAAAMIGEP